MHLLIILAAMLFAAATPYLAIPEGRDVELSDGAASDGSAPDDDSSDDVVVAKEASEERRES